MTRPSLLPVLLPFASLLLKKAVISVFHRRFPDRVEPFELKTHWRGMGWDCSSATLGLVIGAFVVSESNIRRSIAEIERKHGGGAALGLASACLAWYVLLYASAVLIRYGFYERSLKTSKPIGGWVTASFLLATALVLYTFQLY